MSDFSKNFELIKPEGHAAILVKIASERGGIAIFVNEDENNNLHATVACESGLVYRCHYKKISDNIGFWKFAAGNYYWITPGLELRQRLAIELTGMKKSINGISTNRTRQASLGVNHDVALTIFCSIYVNTSGFVPGVLPVIPVNMIKELF